ncbi:MAG: hypothetical protein ACD_79C00993G0002 [uncultured bacterium]|nr:MAG: hypothetical protein ACD_79C00993G0002 [uncultured bacterium]
MKSKAKVKEVKELEVTDPEFFSKRGVEKFNVGDYDGAIEDFEKAISLDSENPNYYNLRGHARFSHNDLKGARSDFNKSKKLKTKSKKQRKASALTPQ